MHVHVILTTCTHTHTSTKSGTVIQPTSDDHLSSLRILAWLMLGAMCHNAVDSAAIEMRMEGNINVGGQCRLLYSFNTNMEVNTRGILKLVKGVLQRLTTANEVKQLHPRVCLLRSRSKSVCVVDYIVLSLLQPNFGFLYLTFMFTAVSSFPVTPPNTIYSHSPLYP